MMNNPSELQQQWWNMFCKEFIHYDQISKTEESEPSGMYLLSASHTNNILDSSSSYPAASCSYNSDEVAKYFTASSSRQTLANTAPPGGTCPHYINFLHSSHLEQSLSNVLPNGGTRPLPAMEYWAGSELSAMGAVSSPSTGTQVPHGCQTVGGFHQGGPLATQDNELFYNPMCYSQHRYKTDETDSYTEINNNSYKQQEVDGNEGALDLTLPKTSKKNPPKQSSPTKRRPNGIIIEDNHKNTDYLDILLTQRDVQKKKQPSKPRENQMIIDDIVNVTDAGIPEDLPDFRVYELRKSLPMTIIRFRTPTWIYSVRRRVLGVSAIKKMFGLNETAQTEIKLLYGGRGLKNPLRTNIPQLATHADHQGKYRCMYCEREFKNPKVLSRHYIQHTTYRKYLCTICWRGFYDTYDLRRHMKKHSEITVFYCELCEAISTQNVSKKSHYEKIHEMNYVPTSN